MEPDDDMTDGIAAGLAYLGDHESDPDPVRRVNVAEDFWAQILSSLSHGDLPDDYPFNPDASRQLMMPPKQRPGN